jgi:hypothetical protein
MQLTSENLDRPSLGAQVSEEVGHEQEEDFTEITRALCAWCKKQCDYPSVEGCAY